MDDVVVSAPVPDDNSAAVQRPDPLDHQGLVAKVSQRYRGCGLDMEDLIRAGNIGLLLACEDYDPKKGPFSSYASWKIRQAISKEVGEHGRSIRLPAYMNQLIYKDYHGKLDIESMSETSRNTFEHAKQLVNQGRSTDSALEDDNLSGIVPDYREPSPISNLMFREQSEDDRQKVLAVLQALSPLYADILTTRYGLDGNEPLSLEEAGYKFGMQLEEIRNLEVHIIDKLRGNFAKQKTNCYSGPGRQRKIPSKDSYCGVKFDSRPRKKPWEAYISFCGQSRHLGYYATNIAAAMAYDVAARKLGLPMNFPDSDEAEIIAAVPRNGFVELPENPLISDISKNDDDVTSKETTEPIVGNCPRCGRELLAKGWRCLHCPVGSSVSSKVPNELVVQREYRIATIPTGTALLMDAVRPEPQSKPSGGDADVLSKSPEFPCENRTASINSPAANGIRQLDAAQKILEVLGAIDPQDVGKVLRLVQVALGISETGE